LTNREKAPDRRWVGYNSLQREGEGQLRRFFKGGDIDESQKGGSKPLRDRCWGRLELKHLAKVCRIVAVS